MADNPPLDLNAPQPSPGAPVQPPGGAPAQVPPGAPQPGAPPPTPDEAARALDDLDELLTRIPGAARLAAEVRDLRDLLVNRRAPRIAVLGRRGSGKSSLANALLGAEVLPVGAVEDTTRSAGWTDVTVHGRTLRWLDTPGLRAGAAPERRSEVERALTVEAPDVVLWLCKATQVDSGIDEDLEEVRAVLAVLTRVRPKTPAPRVVAVVTKVDELAPLAVKAPPYDADEDKRRNIQQAVEVLRGHLARVGITVADVVPVGAYQRFREDARIADWRWNLPVLATAVFAALPRPAQVEAARAFDGVTALRRKLAMRVVGTATSVAFVVGATPLPIADLALLLPLQSGMLTSVVYIAGRGLGPRAVTEWLTGLGMNVGAGLGLREAVRAVLKLVPGLGATVAGAVAATGTWALGVAAVKYFVDGVTAAESRAAFDRAAREGAPPQARGDGGDAPRREGDG